MDVNAACKLHLASKKSLQSSGLKCPHAYGLKMFKVPIESTEILQAHHNQPAAAPQLRQATSMCISPGRLMFKAIGHQQAIAMNASHWNESGRDRGWDRAGIILSSPKRCDGWYVMVGFSHSDVQRYTYI